MSFILDALKKSESERQRQSGPALFEVKVAPPRHRFAVWATALGALLAINLVVVGWMLSRGSSERSASVPPAPLSRPAPTAASPLPVPASAVVPTAAAPSPAPSPASTPAPTPARAPSPAPSAALARMPAPGAAADTAASSPPPAGTGAGAAPVNPDDLAPAVEPQHGTSTSDSGGAVGAESETGLPTYEDAAAQPGADIPALQLNLHVYDPNPDRRFVLLNMTKLQEGDSLPQGVHVDRITPEGVILSYRGTRFVMQNPSESGDRSAASQ